jgi:hypothetical protein
VQLRVAPAVALVVAQLFGSISSAQDTHSGMEMGDMKMESPFHVSAQAIGLVTTASPTAAQHRLTEGYVTQPLIMAMYAFPGNAFVLHGTLDFEGLTLKRGELTNGIWGEGFIDRRHPHTYLHELVFSATSALLKNGFAASLTGGKGFAPFGTDDPMMRPFVKYPANHHLSQVLERFLVIGALREGPVSVEYGLFNGDEPTSPSDFPNGGRFADSWSSRITVKPYNPVEVQASYASVKSPEIAAGGGLDQRKVSVSARYESNDLYSLAEFAQTRDVAHGTESFRFNSFLIESSALWNAYKLAARFELTERPDEERLGNPFRTPVPASDFSITGISRWRIATASVSMPALRRGSLILSPLTELSVARPTPTIANTVFDPRRFYGSTTLWNFSIGLKIAAGPMHERMGRYGVLNVSR